MADLRGQLQEGLSGRYHLEHELGRGGMATVYLAQDLRHDRPVALKVLHPELAATTGPERFQREIKLAARLQHPHILPIHDSGETAGQLWYTMPYVEGESLRHRLRREVQLSVEYAVRIASQVALALDYAHRHGIVHRDVKPENILLSDGQALIADFGVAHALEHTGTAKLTDAGVAVGTPTYMSPEQATGGMVDARSDIYALGCVLYEMLAGEPPFTGPTRQAVIAKRYFDPVPSIRRVRPTSPPHIDAVIARALAKVPADRFATAAEFTQNLNTVSAHSEPASHDHVVGQGRMRHTLWVAMAALLIFAVVGLGYWLPRHPKSSVLTGRALHSPPGVPGAVNDVLALAPAKSVAVLPLVNVGGSTEDEYFSDGVTDELASALSKVPGLRVASRTSAFVFKGRHDVDIREIGRRLGVGAVLEGAVRRAGSRLRVQVQLASTHDGLALWSETYERPTRDVFDIQEEIARSVAEALQIGGPGARAETLPLAGRPDAKAHDLYLRGHFFLWRYTESDARRSVELFQAALREDPKYALPHAGIAQAWMSLADDFIAPKEAWPRVRIAAIQALKLDSTLAEAHTLLGDVFQWYEKDVVAAEREFRRALALNPNDANAHFNLGRLLVLTAHPQAGIEEYHEAIALDPLSAAWPEELGRALVWLDQSDAALTSMRKALQLDPNFAMAHDGLGLVRFAQGDLTEAAAAFERAEALGWRSASFGRAMVYAASGKAEEARRIAHRWEAEATQRWVAPDLIAGIYAMLGERERAFRLLEQAYKEKAGYLLMLNVRPDLAPLQNDRRFAALVKRLGLPNMRDGAPE